MKLIIKGEMTSLNDYIVADRATKYSGARIKKEETERVAWECKAQRLGVAKGKVTAHYKIFTKDNRKDEDNLLFYIKYINDGLVMAGVLKNDSPKYLHIGSVEVLNDGTGARIETELYEE